MTVMTQSEFDRAERVAFRIDATIGELACAADLLVLSPVWNQRVLGREIRAGLNAKSSEELHTAIAKQPMKSPAHRGVLVYAIEPPPVSMSVAWRCVGAGFISMSALIVAAYLVWPL